MPQKYLFLLTTVLLLSLSSCSKDYFLSKGFKQETKVHQMVAIAPVEMIFTGVPLGQIEPEDIQTLEEGESKAFQISLFNQIQFSRSDRKKPINIEFLTVDQTNDRLAAKGISIRDSWALSGEELAKVLEVDAVVKTKVYKTRYLTDMASMGVDLGRKIAALLSKGKALLALYGDLDKTSDIRATSQLVNATDGKLLWSMQLVDETDWNNPTPEIVDRISKKFAANFPYRYKRR